MYYLGYILKQKKGLPLVTPGCTEHPGVTNIEKKTENKFDTQVSPTPGCHILHPDAK